MTESTATMNVLEDVMNSMFRSKPVKWFANRWEKIFAWIGGVAIACVVISFMLFSYAPWPQPQWPWWATLTLLFSVIYFISWLIVILRAFQSMFRPERTLLAPVVVAFDEELGLMAHLSRTYERHDLEYASDRMSLVGTHLRSRIAITVGALDKIGVIPLVIAAYFSLLTLLQEQPPTSAELNWIVGGSIGLGFVYMSGLYLLGWTHRVEEVCLVLKHAVQTKKEAQSPGDKPS